jgi:hypothetical protein
MPVVTQQRAHQPVSVAYTIGPDDKGKHTEAVWRQRPHALKGYFNLKLAISAGGLSSRRLF